MVRVRSIFLSDVHLGTPACQAAALLEFLKAYDSEYLFLVGDIVDFWAIRRRGVYWSTEQNTVVLDYKLDPVELEAAEKAQPR